MLKERLIKGIPGQNGRHLEGFRLEISPPLPKSFDRRNTFLLKSFDGRNTFHPKSFDAQNTFLLKLLDVRNELRISGDFICFSFYLLYSLYCKKKAWKSLGISMIIVNFAYPSTKSRGG